MQIRIQTNLSDIGSKCLVILQTLANKVLGTARYLGRRGEPNVSRVEHNIVGKDVILRLSIAERPLAKEHLIEDYANRPNIDLVADADALMRQETLGRQVPVSTSPLTGKLHAIASFRSINNLTQSKICDLGITMVIK